MKINKLVKRSKLFFLIVLFFSIFYVCSSRGQAASEVSDRSEGEDAYDGNDDGRRQVNDVHTTEDEEEEEEDEADTGEGENQGEPQEERNDIGETGEVEEGDEEGDEEEEEEEDAELAESENIPQTRNTGGKNGGKFSPMKKFKKNDKKAGAPSSVQLSTKNNKNASKKRNIFRTNTVEKKMKTPQQKNGGEIKDRRRGKTGGGEVQGMMKNGVRSNTKHMRKANEKNMNMQRGRRRNQIKGGEEEGEEENVSLIGNVKQKVALAALWVMDKFQWLTDYVTCRKEKKAAANLVANICKELSCNKKDALINLSTNEQKYDIFCKKAVEYEECKKEEKKISREAKSFALKHSLKNRVSFPCFFSTKKNEEDGGEVSMLKKNMLLDYDKEMKAFMFLHDKYRLRARRLREDMKAILSSVILHDVKNIRQNVNMKKQPNMRNFHKGGGGAGRRPLQKRGGKETREGGRRGGGGGGEKIKRNRGKVEEEEEEEVEEMEEEEEEEEEETEEMVEEIAADEDEEK